jgi:quercetin dioxygenase-like cupin family protein
MALEFTLGPEEGKLVWLVGLGVRFLARGEQTGGRFAVVEHPIKPRALAAPLHTHEGEDEISYVVEGRVGVQVGDQVRVAGPGTVIFKPRGIPHAFWNAGDAPARLIEIITPAGFEKYFEEAAQLFGPSGPRDPEQLQALQARYRLHMDFGSIPALINAHGLATI